MMEENPMRKVRFIAITILCTSCLCVSAAAQSPVAPLPESQRATDGQIATLLNAMRIQDQMSAVLELMPMVVQQQVQKLRESFKGPQLTSEQQEKIEKFLQQRAEKVMEIYPIEEIIADTGTIYQKYISREDADVLIAFYQTPAAQRLIDVQPAMVQEYLPAIMSRMETRVKTFAEDTARETQEFLKELLGNH
jgi:hypothetical protein